MTTQTPNHKRSSTAMPNVLQQKEHRLAPGGATARRRASTADSEGGGSPC